MSARRGTALITGASMGLGAEFARVLASEGYDLILTARSADKLDTVRREVENLHGVSVRVVVQDLAVPGAPQTLYDAVRGTRIDILINNAGFGQHGLFHRSDLQNELDMIQVNVTALVHLTKLFLRDMVVQGSGRIMNVSSMAAFQPGPLQPVYYASKAFVQSFTEAIANELKGTGVTATALCPGPTPTGFQQRANVGQLRGLRLLMRISPEAVVRAGIDGMHAGRAIVIPGLLNKILAFLVRFFPRGLVTSIVRRMQTHEIP